MPVATKREPSLLNKILGIAIGLTIATKPKINPRLKMLDPTILPTEIADWPLKAAETVTANSGAEVAIATTVNPITKSESPNFLAILEAASTTQVAPPQRPRMHALIIRMFIKIISPES